MCMCRARKPHCDTVDETILRIGKECDVINLGDGDWKVAVHDRIEVFEKPILVVVVFGTNDGKSARKQLSAGINTRSHKQNAAVY
jgi:hypothetical protein